MRPKRLQRALAALGDAMREVNAAVEEMREEHGPLAVHIFVSRRTYRNMHDTKSGKRSDTLKKPSGVVYTTLESPVTISACAIGLPVRASTTCPRAAG
jgi:hypothetical protein